MKYRHAFHAGNFADVHKHASLLACLEALTRKDKGLLYVETHAGAGIYDLAAPSPQQSREADQGIEKLLQAPLPAGMAQASAALARYVEWVRQCRVETRLKHAYPGSPWLAAHALRRQDRAVLHEIQAADCATLARILTSSPATGTANMQVLQADGYRALRAVLPPPERRGFVLIDPPYEDADADRTQILAALADALQRFATGVYAIWYPMKLAAERDRWLSQLATLCARAEPNARSWVASELWVHALDSRASLAGSGLFIVNPPFQLALTLGALNRELHALLAGSLGGHCVVDRL